MKTPLSYSPIDFEALRKSIEQVGVNEHLELVKLFEMRLSDWLGSPHQVVSTISGTSAIHLALLAIGVKADDTVVVPTFTYIGTVAPVLYVGAKPIFIDCDTDTWGMDPVLLEQCLMSEAKRGKLPKAVIVADCYGMPAKWNEINAICQRYQVAVVEDAACALGGFYHRRPCGTLADIGVFSFNSNKTITAFGGGALVTKSKDMANRAQFMAAFAREQKPYYHFEEIGYNYRMSPLNAAYGVSQIGLIEAKVEERRTAFVRYMSALTPLGATFLSEPSESKSTRWLTTMTLPRPVDIPSFVKSEKIELRPVWAPLHKQPLFAGTNSYVRGVAEQLFELGICLPVGMRVTDADVLKLSEFIRG